MSGSSQPNPYVDWLGIAADECPPDYFQLLGIPSREQNEMKIKSAYYRRVAKVSVAGHQDDSGLSERLLTELGIARDCLLEQNSREEYLRALQNGYGVARGKLLETTGGEEELKLAAERPQSEEFKSVFAVVDAIPDPSQAFGGHSTPRRQRPQRKRIDLSQDGAETAPNPFGILTVARSPEEIVQEVLASGQVNSFQREEVEQGRGESLVVGPFLLQNPIAQGTWADHYVASRISTGSLVSLSVLTDKFGDDVTPLKQLVSKAARIKSPYLHNVVDCGAYGHRLFLAHELVEGEDLDSFVKRCGPLSLYQAIYCVDCVARGLKHALAGGLVHGQIRANKVLLTKQGDVQIRDLVLANLATHLRIFKQNPRSDMTDLGHLIVFGLTGKVNPHADAKAAPATLRELDDSIPENLDQVYQRLLSVDPKQSFRSFDELRQALKTVYQSLPRIAASPAALFTQVGSSMPKDRVKPIRLSKISPKRLATWAGVGLVGCLLLISTWSYLNREAPLPVQAKAPEPTPTPTTTVLSKLDRLPSGEIPTVESDSVFKVQ